MNLIGAFGSRALQLASPTSQWWKYDRLSFTEYDVCSYTDPFRTAHFERDILVQ